jgi:hypothetical protein
MKRHLNKKILCKKMNIDSARISDDQNLILSLIPYYNGIHNINNDDLTMLDKSDIVNKNRHKLFELLDEIELNKLKKCKHCNEEFNKIYDLKNHVLTKCFYQYLLKNTENNTIINNSITNNGNGNNNYNHSNITNNNNITNNIYLELKTPLPFDGEWDLSEIDHNLRARLLLSQIMYTTLLDEILKNDKNLNVIIDKESKSGLVYKNDIEKYTPMKLIDILDESMDKLKNYLLQFNEEESSKEEFEKQILRYGKAMVLSKYRNYKDCSTIQSNVNNLITNIFDKKKNEAIQISKDIEKNLLFPNGY